MTPMFGALPVKSAVPLTSSHESTPLMPCTSTDIFGEMLNAERLDNSPNHIPNQFPMIGRQALESGSLPYGAANSTMYWPQANITTHARAGISGADRPATELVSNQSDKGNCLESEKQSRNDGDSTELGSNKDGNNVALAEMNLAGAVLVSAQDRAVNKRQTAVTSSISHLPADNNEAYSLSSAECCPQANTLTRVKPGISKVNPPATEVASSDEVQVTKSTDYSSARDKTLPLNGLIQTLVADVATNEISNLNDVFQSKWASLCPNGNVSVNDAFHNGAPPIVQNTIQRSTLPTNDVPAENKETRPEFSSISSQVNTTTRPEAGISEVDQAALDVASSDNIQIIEPTAYSSVINKSLQLTRLTLVFQNGVLGTVRKTISTRLSPINDGPAANKEAQPDFNVLAISADSDTATCGKADISEVNPPANDFASSGEVQIATNGIPSLTAKPNTRVPGTHSTSSAQVSQINIVPDSNQGSRPKTAALSKVDQHDSNSGSLLVTDNKQTIKSADVLASNMTNVNNTELVQTAGTSSPTQIMISPNSSQQNSSNSVKSILKPSTASAASIESHYRAQFSAAQISVENSQDSARRNPLQPSKCESRSDNSNQTSPNEPQKIDTPDPAARITSLPGVQPVSVQNNDPVTNQDANADAALSAALSATELRENLKASELSRQGQTVSRTVDAAPSPAIVPTTTWSKPGRITVQNPNKLNRRATKSTEKFAPAKQDAKPSASAVPTIEQLIPIAVQQESLSTVVIQSIQQSDKSQNSDSFVNIPIDDSEKKTFSSNEQIPNTPLKSDNEEKVTNVKDVIELQPKDFELQIPEIQPHFTNQQEIVSTHKSVVNVESFKTEETGPEVRSENTSGVQSAFDHRENSVQTSADTQKVEFKSVSTPQAVLNAVFEAARNPLSLKTIEIRTDGFGTIRIRLTRDEDAGLKVEIHASDPAAHALLSNNVTALKQGMRADTVVVQFRQSLPQNLQQSAEQRGSNSQQHSSRRGGGYREPGSARSKIAESDEVFDLESES